MPVLTERSEKLRSMVQVKDPFAPVRLAPVAVNGTSVPQVGVEIFNDEGAWEEINILFSKPVRKSTKLPMNGRHGLPCTTN